MADFKKYKCSICDHIYDEAIGDPDSGIEPGSSLYIRRASFLAKEDILSAQACAENPTSDKF